MNDRMFDNPVFVKQGTGIIQEIACLEDALEFLYDWPKKRRGPIHQTAVRACQRVYESEYPLSAAKQAFIGFATSAKILEQVSTPLPLMTASTGRGGDLAT